MSPLSRCETKSLILTALSLIRLYALIAGSAPYGQQDCELPRPATPHKVKVLLKQVQRGNSPINCQTGVGTAVPVRWNLVHSSITDPGALVTEI